ncbi:MAG: hypothetical protein JNK59_12630, partial [Sterolibacteriaceae bacterium]|nr:hypothetical protein [Sterolibacteriaceae bacterium]
TWLATPTAWALMSPATWQEMQRKGLPMTEVLRDTRRVIVRKGPPPNPRPEGGDDDCFAARGASSASNDRPGLGRPCAGAKP